MDRFYLLGGQPSSVNKETECTQHFSLCQAVSKTHDALQRLHSHFLFRWRFVSGFNFAEKKLACTTLSTLLTGLVFELGNSKLLPPCQKRTFLGILTNTIPPKLSWRITVLLQKRKTIKYYSRQVISLQNMSVKQHCKAGIAWAFKRFKKFLKMVWPPKIILDTQFKRPA